jgi:hypothetical protein
VETPEFNLLVAEFLDSIGKPHLAAVQAAG